MNFQNLPQFRNVKDRKLLKQLSALTDAAPAYAEAFRAPLISKPGFELFKGFADAISDGAGGREHLLCCLGDMDMFAAKHHIPLTLEALDCVLYGQKAVLLQPRDADRHTLAVCFAGQMFWVRTQIYMYTCMYGRNAGYGCDKGLTVSAQIMKNLQAQCAHLDFGQEALCLARAEWDSKIRGKVA